MNRYDFVTDLAKEAGEMVLSLREKHVDISIKDNDPRNLVTNVDIEISEFVSSRILSQFPGEKIYSEEADEDISRGSCWTIDPIDGTALFSRGIPYFSVVVGYVDNGVPIVGAIYNPVTKEMFSFEKGKGAFLNGVQVKVSEKTELAESFVLIHTGRDRNLWDWGAGAHRFLLERANKNANFGSSAQDICFVGCGRIEATIYGNLTPVDISAAIGFIHEAGGQVLGPGATPIDCLSKKRQRVIAVNNKDILAALQEGIEI